MAFGYRSFPPLQSLNLLWDLPEAAVRLTRYRRATWMGKQTGNCAPVHPASARIAADRFIDVSRTNGS